jgi:hypothetical protein
MHSGITKEKVIGIRIILKRILKRKEMRFCTHVKSFQIELRGRICKQWNIS